VFFASSRPSNSVAADESATADIDCMYVLYKVAHISTVFRRNTPLHVLLYLREKCLNFHKIYMKEGPSIPSV